MLTSCDAMLSTYQPTNYPNYEAVNKLIILAEVF